MAGAGVAARVAEEAASGGTEAAVGSTACPAPARPFVLVATILASAMAFIDANVVNIALPAIQRDLGAGFAAVQWVVNAYALLLGGLILIGGAAGDRFGRKRIFLLGIALFGLSSLACALAPTAGTLIAARAAQGLGAALLVPQSLAIIAATFPKAVRGHAIGIWAGASAITTSMGPPLGGILVDLLDWRAVFWVNLPFSAAALWFAARHIAESRNAGASGSLDWPGAVLAITAFGALTVGLTLFSDAGGPVWPALALLAVAAGALVLFLRVEATAPSPLVPLALFADRAFAAANLLTLFLYGALRGIMFLLPFELIARRGLSAIEVGLTLLPVGLMIGLVSRRSGAWADRHGPARLLVAGSLLVGGAAAVLAVQIGAFVPGIALPVAMLACGMALVVAPLTTAVMNAAADDRVGAASGINNAASRIAGLLSVAVLGSIAGMIYFGQVDGAGLAHAGLRFGVLPAPGEADRAVLEAAFDTAYAAAMAAAAVLGVLAALVAHRHLRPAPGGGA
ncbi:MAG: MFS transporter [Rhodospirillaceae bacterium]|nr:MFS transporter [Rhodospirillaceae bacterium]